MKNIKNDIPAIAGLLTTASLAVVSGGLMNPALANIGASLAANFLTGFTPAKIKKWFVDVHPDDLNHSIKKLFVASIQEALHNVSVLFVETQATGNEKKDAKQLVKTLQKHLPEVLLDGNRIRLDEPEIKKFLYETDKGDVICQFVENQFETFGITDPFRSFMAKNLPAQIQLCFGEGLKDPGNQNAWIAFQRMLMEEIRNDIKQIAGTQQSIKDDLSDLKFTQSGLSEGQIAEIRQLIQILNDKKLVEVKIKNGIIQSLKSVENKANEIIRITTKTRLTVDELKVVVEKIRRQNCTQQIIMYALAACLLLSGAFVAYRVLHQPFTATVKIYGWEGETHQPLNGKGAIVLTLGDKTEKAEINRQGEAVFKGIPPEYNGKMAEVRIVDTENEPYYLTSSTIKIPKNDVVKVQALLRGLEKLEGTVFDNISGEGLPGVTVTVAGESATTDEKGNFSVDIPLEKQRMEQEIDVSKEGYKSKRQTIPMAGDNKYRTVLERKKI